MATYIPGITDYIPQVQPFQPDLNFYANVMQTKQGKYDAAKKQISNLYGTLLYSPLTRDQNIQRRDEFFKVIDEDIKKISGMDLSLQQNVDQATQVFNGFYNDKYMVQDMVWTKNLNNAMQKHAALKNCFDPKKCGGIAWDEGLQELQYRRDEFRNISDDESMNFAMPTYTPYYEWKKDAMKAAADMGYNVVQDSFSKNGDYIITDKNGDLVKGGLYTVFKEAYGSDPRVEANYNTMAYVKRNNAARADASLYGSVEEAERQYIGGIINQGVKNISSQLSKTNRDYDETAARIAQLEKKQLNKALTPAEEKILANAKSQKEALEQTHNYLHKNLNAILANAESGDIQSLRRRADASTAQVLLESDLNSLAVAMSMKGKEQTIKVNPMAEIKRRHEADKALAGYKHNLDMIEMKQKHIYDIDLEHIKSMEEMGLLAAKSGLKGDAQGQGTMTDAFGYEIKEGVPGTNVQLGIDKDKAAGYEYTKKSVMEPMADVNHGSLKFLWNAFVAAKGAAENADPSVGAKNWLDKTVGKNWKNITDESSFAKAFEGKSVNTLYHSTLNLLKAGKTGDVSWGDNLISENAKLIDTIKIKSTAANGKLTAVLNENLKVAENMKSLAQTNPLYKYADDLFIKGAYDAEMGKTNPNKASGFLVSGNTPSKSFIINYLKDHPYDDMGDIEDAWDTLKTDYLDRYNREAKTVGTGAGLVGEGMVSGNTLVENVVDPADKRAGSTNVDVVKTLSGVLNSDAYEVGLGANSKANLENTSPEVREQLAGIVNQFASTIARPWSVKDKERPMYGIQAAFFGAEDQNKAALTIKLPADYVQKNTGEGKMFSKELAPEVMANGITVYYDKNAVKTPLVEKAKGSDFADALKYGTNLDIESFNDTAGKLKISYNSLKDEATFIIEPFQYDINGNKNPLPAVSNKCTLAQAESMYAAAQQNLTARTEQNNKQLEQILAIKRAKALQGQ